MPLGSRDDVWNRVNLLEMRIADLESRIVKTEATIAARLKEEADARMKAFHHDAHLEVR